MPATQPSEAPKVRVSRKGADRVASGHPWIFVGDVVDRGTAAAGDAVRVVDPRGRLLGMAHYSSTSQICLRMLTTGEAVIDRAFYADRIGQAARYRERVAPWAEACRLVYGEGDRLPGLVVDRYGPYLVIQTLSQGMDRARDLVVECLRERYSPAGVIARNDAAVRQRESLPLGTAVLFGEVPDAVTMDINGLRFQADLRRGQKTGIFLDQRENWLAAARYARGRALDCFCYGGGFALHLAAHCESVLAVDSSEDALGLAARNAAANGIANVQFRQADVFELLAGMATSDRRYGAIVLDPPAFAKSRAAVSGALRGYREINTRALRLLEPGGVLVSCSCSHHVSEAMLLEVVAQAALDAGRALRVLERRTQALDHPILLTVPETCYLKCLILEAL